MAITSYPFDGQAVSEAQFSKLFSALQFSGVVGDYNGTDFKVTANSSGLEVHVASGFAIVRGHAVNSTATEDVAISTPGASMRKDLIVLELDPSTNSITLQAITSGSSTPPSPTQTSTGIFQLPLAEVTVEPGVASIASSKVKDIRNFTGQQVRSLTNDSKDYLTNVQRGALVFDRSQAKWQWWDGTSWQDVQGSVDWTDVTGKPTTFTPSLHLHSWGDIMNKPQYFQPYPHTHSWNELEDKPYSFPPMSHTHPWSKITSKPSTFPPSSHTHSGSQVTSQVERARNAYGTDNCHQYAAGGDGPWYSVWVNAEYKFMRNTSSIRFKENVRDAEMDPEAVLNLRPVLFDRKDQTDPEDGSTIKGNKDEFGLIAEEVDESLPQVVIRDAEGQIDAVRYDLLPVAMIPLLKQMQDRINDLEARLEAMEGGS